MNTLTPNHVHVSLMDMKAGLIMLSRITDEWSRTHGEILWRIKCLNEMAFRHSLVTLPNDDITQWAMAVAAKQAYDDRMPNTGDRCRDYALSMLKSASDTVVLGKCTVCFK